MGRYTFLPHTADEKFVVEAKDLDDAFSTCLDAFYEIMIPKQKVKKNFSKEFTIKSARLRSLLYDFLNELVLYFDEEDLLLRNVEKLHVVQKDGSWQLSATLSGDKHYKYDLVTEIKNMTYSDMDIVRKEDGVKITLVVDI